MLALASHDKKCQPTATLEMLMLRSLLKIEVTQ